MDLSAYSLFRKKSLLKNFIYLWWLFQKLIIWEKKNSKICFKEEVFISFSVFLITNWFMQFWLVEFVYCIINWNKMWNFAVLCRLHQDALQLGRWRSLRKTSQKEEVCQKPLLRKEKTILLAPCCLVSSSLLLLDHVRLSF